MLIQVQKEYFLEWIKASFRNLHIFSVDKEARKQWYRVCKLEKDEEKLEFIVNSIYLKMFLRDTFYKKFEIDKYSLNYDINSELITIKATEESDE